MHIYKKNLAEFFYVLGTTRIVRDRVKATLRLSQKEYVKKVLSRFNLNDVKSISTPLESNVQLYKGWSSKIEQDCEHMNKVSYLLAFGSFVYVMVCTRPNTACSGLWAST